MELKAAYPVKVLQLSGDLGMKEFFSLEQVLENFCQEEEPQVVLDFSEVTHAHYRGFKGLKKKLKQLKASKGELKLAGFNPYVERIFNFSGLFNELSPHQDLNEAILSFERPFEPNWH